MVRPAAAIPLDIDEGGSRPSAGIRLLPNRRRPAARKPPLAVPPDGDCRPTSGTPPHSGSRAPRYNCITGAPHMARLCQDTTRLALVGCQRSCWIQLRGPTANLPGRASRERDETRPERRGTWIYKTAFSSIVVKKHTALKSKLNLNFFFEMCELRVFQLITVII